MSIGASSIGRGGGQPVPTTAPASPIIGGGLTYALLKQRLALPPEYLGEDTSLESYLRSGLALIARLTSLPLIQRTQTFAVSLTTGALIIWGEEARNSPFGAKGRTKLVLPVVGVTNAELTYYAGVEAVGGATSHPHEASNGATEINFVGLPANADSVRVVVTCWLDISDGAYKPLQDALVIYVRARFENRDWMREGGMPPAFKYLIEEFQS